MSFDNVFKRSARAVKKIKCAADTGNCRADYAELNGLDVAAKGATDKADRKRHYWGSLTAYYPAENPQYRIFVIMEQNIYNGTYYGVPLCAPVVARIIKSLNN